MHDNDEYTVIWSDMFWLLRYAWWCLHILSDKYSTIQGMLTWWWCTSIVWTVLNEYSGMMICMLFTLIWWYWWHDACHGVMTYFYALWCVLIKYWWWVHILDDDSTYWLTMIHTWWYWCKLYDDACLMIVYRAVCVAMIRLTWQWIECRGY